MILIFRFIVDDIIVFNSSSVYESFNELLEYMMGSTGGLQHLIKKALVSYIFDKFHGYL